MEYLEFIRHWQENVWREAMHERFTFEGYDLWDFLEPLLIGNSGLHDFCNFPQLFKAVTGQGSAKPTKSFKGRLARGLLATYFRLRSALRPLLAWSKPVDWQPLLFLSSERFRGREHLIFGNIFTILEREGIDYSLVEFDAYDDVPRIKSLSPHRSFIGAYYTRGVRKRIRELAKRMGSFFEEARVAPEFRRIFRFEKDWYPLVEEQIGFFFRVMPFFLAEVLIVTREILERSKPTCVVFVNETDFYAKGVIQNARLMEREGITTIGLQVGLIIKGCDINPTIRTIPTVKCVDSEEIKRVLVDFYQYPARVVQITGEPRFDDLTRWDRERTVRELDLDPKKPTVVFFDQASGIRLMAKDIALALNDLVGEYNVLIKLHPMEKRSTTPIYKRHCAPEVKITRYETKQLLNLADVVVTCWSSVSFEAIMLGKPLILVNFEKVYHSFLEYDTDGSAIRVYDRSQFKRVVDKCLSDPETMRGLREGRSQTLRKAYDVPVGSASSLITEGILKKCLQGGRLDGRGLKRRRKRERRKRVRKGEEGRGKKGRKKELS